MAAPRRVVDEGVRSRIRSRCRTRACAPAGSAVGARDGGHRIASPWHVRPGPRLRRAQKDWVSRGGALTAHLGRLGQVSVRVVSEGIAAPWLDEAATMRRPSVHPTRSLARVWTREVELRVDGVPCVLAHSITPLRASHTHWKAMRQLQTRPLADLLYHDSTVRRSLLVSRRAGHRGDPLYRLMERAAGGVPRNAVVRRSVFDRHGSPLLITECFLPAFWDLLARDRRASRL